LASLAATALLLTGCAAGGPPPYLKAQGGGADGRIGQIAVTDALFAYPGPVPAPVVYQPGAAANLEVTVINEGAQPDRLVSVSSPVAGGGEIVGDASLPAQHALTTGYPGQPAGVTLPGTTAIQVRLTGLTAEIRAGRTYPVVFAFDRAGAIRLDLPVDNPDQPRAGCPLPPDGRPPEIFTAPIGGAPVPPLAPPPACGSLVESRDVQVPPAGGR
jgi:hypothetical protein